MMIDGTNVAEESVAPSNLLDVRALLLSNDELSKEFLDKLEQAIASYQVVEIRQALVELDQRSASPRDQMISGVCHYMLGRQQEAVEKLSQSHGNALAAYYFANALAALKQFDDADKAMVEAKKLGYDPVVCELERAGFIRQSGNLDKADEILTESAKSGGATRAEYCYQRACILADRGDTFGAIEYFERAVDMEPKHTGALFRLAGLNDLMGNDEEAVQLYERSLSKPPLYLGALLNLGLLYEDRENYSAAAYCFRRVLEVYPNHERARLFLKDIEAAGDMYYDEEAARHQRELEQVMGIPVTDFELSARARNCLERAGINSLGDLTLVTENELLSGKNFGETSLNEIKDLLTSKGLRIGQQVQIDLAPKPAFQPDDLSPQERATMERPVTDLNLSVRARKCLGRLGLANLGELCQRTPDELMSVRNFGVTSLNEIRQKLAEFNLKLRND
ncbi:DNA-directed RNA polymerase subunit alpha C-terminal domain-containing protein [Calycomorphotria hydatis]|uniref:DNA-directed RNA polymerase subunit alpha n=1 Tax=Calycomorphotria hydatis TaxID=2528027 RepID=A0A517T3F8_9PLAN|nr:DNA-directed RNA polymerase subunit alpha C-terminal domain-containing protein [Calycomorphotria hydatis]QDT62915.1 DNA-directed RNA polymerase subunit alpha [Calycomorphotria hydatis]